MKKTAAYLALFLFIVAIASSCKSHEKCPAYGKAPIEQSADSYTS